VTVTDLGKDDIKATVLVAFAVRYKWFGVGSDNSPEVVTDTDLGNPIEVWEGSRVYRKEVDSVFTDGENIIWVCRIGQGEFNKSGIDVNINEIGIFNAQSGGTMILRKVLPATLIKNNSKEYVVLVKLKLWEVV